VTDVFYVKAKDGSFVPAQYMQLGGEYVINKNLVNTPYDKNLPDANVLYDANGNRLPDSQQNIYARLIVPVNFSEIVLTQALAA
jgi:hypothetical protein